jgi:hypothetical protein
MVFTGRGISQILEDGGSQAWALNAVRARKCEYLICVQNHPGEPWAKPEASQGTAFLIGRVSGVEPAGDEHGANRWIINISEYAEIKDRPNMWDGSRNPVRYTTMEDLGLDPTKFAFKPVAKNPATSESGPMIGTEGGRPAGATALSIEQAKRGLAAYFGVSIDAIEITIRG